MPKRLDPARRADLKARVRSAIASRPPGAKILNHWLKARFPWEDAKELRRLADEVAAEDARAAFKAEVRAVVAGLVAAGIEPTGNRLQKIFPGRGNYSLCVLRDELADEGLVDWEPDEAPDRVRSKPGLSGATEAERALVWERARRLREGLDLDTGEPVGPPKLQAGRPLTLAQQLRQMNLYHDPRPAGEREVHHG